MAYRPQVDGQEVQPLQQLVCDLLDSFALIARDQGHEILAALEGDGRKAPTTKQRPRPQVLTFNQTD